MNICRCMDIPSKHINVTTSTIANVHERYFNVNISLKRKVELTYVYWCCFYVEMRLLFYVSKLFLEFYKNFKLSKKFFLVSSQIHGHFNVAVNGESKLTRWRRFNVDITSTDVATLLQHTVTLKLRWVFGGYVYRLSSIVIVISVIL